MYEKQIHFEKKFKIIIDERSVQHFFKRTKNEHLFGNFIEKKDILEKILFTTLPKMLEITMDQLDWLNTTTKLAYENHLHTFSMMRFILRLV